MWPAMDRYFISLFWQEPSEVGTAFSLYEESEAHWNQVPCPEDTQMLRSRAAWSPWHPSLLFLLSHTASQDMCSRCLVRLIWHCNYLITYYLEVSIHCFFSKTIDVLKIAQAYCYILKSSLKHHRHDHLAKFARYSVRWGSAFPPRAFVSQLCLYLAPCLSTPLPPDCKSHEVRAINYGIYISIPGV